MKTAGLAVFLLGSLAFAAEERVEQWGLFELSLPGPTNGNPFTDVHFSAEFVHVAASATNEVAGFYDGDGVYRVRLMPFAPGPWRYLTRSSAAQLDGRKGEFTVSPPSAKNHGPVRITNVFHFAYADGKPFKQIGTTCYAWTHQGDALEEQTLKTLASAPFNKLRFCVFPKHYDWNSNEPPLYPFEGTPPAHWDKTRFN
ncbi:MAG TPA: DUF5060 domain-containing protein, partial [Methylomirabilota bacterium]|nr:DUF5060 domain-containing protein [Methylomirabilota bacterium]